MFVTVVSEFQVIIALLILGGGLLIASYEEDNRTASSKANTRLTRTIAENRRRFEEGTTTQRN